MYLEQLKLSCGLGLKLPAVVSFYGAGGKSALINCLAEELGKLGKKILLTTTTKIALTMNMPLFYESDTTHTLSVLKEHYKSNNTAVLGSKIIERGKLKGIKPGAVRRLYEELGVTILIEADGSKGLPLKGYATYEPVLPACSSYIAAVVGADALYSPFNANSVHRPEMLSPVTGSEVDDPITEKTVSHALEHMLHIGKKQAPRAESFAIINKTDLLKYPGPVTIKIANLLAERKVTANRLLATEANSQSPVMINLGLHQNKPTVSVSCIILAAGASSRMGREKLLLKINDKTILQTTLEQVMNSGIEDIVVVVKPDLSRSETIATMGCKVVENLAYQKGLSSSLKLGLKAVDNNTQGVILALGDQPTVPKEVYRALIDRYSENLKPATVPVYKGKRGNPVLFDRKIWPALTSLKGDTGGRQIIENLDKEEINRVETGSSSILNDIDTQDDYKNITNSTAKD